MQKITPCLWFDGKAEQAAEFYVSVFEDGKIHSVSRYGKEGQEVHGQPEGQAMMVIFELMGQMFQGLNGGPQFKFDEAISFVIDCKDQKEVDYYWSHLTSEGGEESMCGWLKDRFGVSWQVVPKQLGELISKGSGAQSGRVMNAMLQMKKLDVAALEEAFAG